VQPDQTSSEQTDIRAYLAVIRHRKWTILLVTLVVVGTALVFSFRQTPVYTSDARVYVTPIGPSASATTATVNLETERGLVDSVAVASIVRSDLGLSQPADALLRNLDVSVETDTAILDVRYTDRVPSTAQQLANGFADAYLKFRHEQAAKQIQDQAAAIQGEIDSTQADLARVEGNLRRAKRPARQSQLSADRDSLIARLGALQQQLQVLQISFGSQTGGSVVQPAIRPSSPSSPNHLRNGVLALLLGLALGVGLAFLRERLDDTLRGREDLEETARAPILAVVPRVPDWKDHDFPELVSRVAPKSGPAEAYRTLRTNLQFLGHDGDLRILCVTSPSLGDGKTTTVANLGLSLAQAGRKVIIVSCDLRRPRLHRFFGLDNETGLSSVLSGQLDVAKAIRRPDVENVVVMPSGPVPPNPAELLSSDRMVELLAELRRASDIAILDTPPILAVADALQMAAKSDGTLIVADAESTRRAAVRHVRQQLDQVGARVVGAVLNNFDAGSARYSAYGGYRYMYAYPYEEAGRDGSKGADNGKPDSPPLAQKTPRLLGYFTDDPLR
jgi:tyrosine-protein kinase